MKPTVVRKPANFEIQHEGAISSYPAVQIQSQPQTQPVRVQQPVSPPTPTKPVPQQPRGAVIRKNPVMNMNIQNNKVNSVNKMKPADCPDCKEMDIAVREQTIKMTKPKQAQKKQSPFPFPFPSPPQGFPQLPQLPQLPTQLPQLPTQLPQLPSQLNGILSSVNIPQPKMSEEAVATNAITAADIGTVKAQNLALDVARTFPDPRGIPQVVALNTVNNAATLPVEVARIILQTLTMSTGAK